MTDTSKFVINGESKTQDEMTAFFAKVEREHEAKGKELATYLEVVADHTGRRLNALTEIKCRSENMDAEVMRLLMTMVLSRVVRGQTKLKNGTGKGEWNNGDMGSRWWDAEVGEVSCRVAFYSKRFSDNWTRDKPYALTLTFEKA